jgi:DNA-damage-inducible protein J
MNRAADLAGAATNPPDPNLRQCGWRLTFCRKANIMSETIINVPVDERAKQEADAALAPLGLTTADVLRRAVEEIARNATSGTLRIVEIDLDKPLVPNDETIAAIEAVERGEVKTFETIEEFFADLHSDADD